MHPILEKQNVITRRRFFERSAYGIGSAALASLLSRDGFTQEKPRTPGPHFPPKAKHVIYLFIRRRAIHE